ncbi:MAG: hypothetical protein ACE5Q4_03875 [Nitrosopumilus sp.]
MPKHKTNLSPKDGDAILIHFIEKNMRKITKDIKEKRKILIKKHNAYKAIENSYNASLMELKEYEKKRDELMAKHTSEKTTPV